jgi:hypothetical protein
MSSVTASKLGKSLRTNPGRCCACSHEDAYTVGPGEDFEYYTSHDVFEVCSGIGRGKKAPPCTLVDQVHGAFQGNRFVSRLVARSLGD